MGAHASPNDTPPINPLSEAERQLLALTRFAEPSADGEPIAASDEEPGFVWEKWAIAVLVAGVVANGLFQALAVAGVLD